MPEMLTDSEVIKVKDHLDNCQRPFIFFHDDPDGLASFLLFYRYKGEGRGYPLKAFPRLTAEHAAKVHEYGADKVFVLDIALADQEFFDALGVPCIWIDHHSPQERTKVEYYNPRKRDNLNIPTPNGCYQVVQQDLWIATLGSIGDWYLPPLAKEFHAHYPDLLAEDVPSVEEALFNSPVSKLIKLLSFVLKGPTNEVMQAVKILTRIESPYEILREETPRAKWLMKKYHTINQIYEKLMKKAEKSVTKDPLIVFTYTDDTLSLTKDLANELLYKYNDKIIVLGREKSGEVRCSLRSGKNTILLPLVQRALIGVQGYGGGHEHAVGAGIKKEDFQLFLDNLRRELQAQR
ncbi:DHH family phosphoesterase [Candidatus Woesearchaeota archaeon]|nr:DHH family phosphoesterase [Candidatus Woesearchaeota archaeon]